MHVHTLIIGAGPGGLSCAKILADHGIDTLLIERNNDIGSKVCAGGVTWSGLISRLPETLVEKSFPHQFVKTPLQSITVCEKQPIIATVNRIRLGQHMAHIAREAGANIRTGLLLRQVKPSSICVQDTTTGENEEISYDYLVGADGSNSPVRRYLQLDSKEIGVGINYQIPGDINRMEWHLNNTLFGNGYGWIFPHANTISIGAYAARSTMPAAQLQKNLIQWASLQGYDLNKQPAQAGSINYGFQGWNFGKTFLIGDAAGLASGLTGEGIYPAIISGEQVALTIVNSAHSSSVMDTLIRTHAKHSKALRISGKNGLLNSLLGELVTLGLRSGIVRFNKLEMAC